MTDANKREEGARDLKERPGMAPQSPIHTGDKADQPKRPYGLTGKTHHTNEKTRQSDGRQVKRDAEAQFFRSNAGKDNDGTVSAEPRVISGDGSGDATFPLRQNKGRPD